MDSEFKQFLDTLKRLGIKFSINWRPARQVWQQIIKTARYDVTALSCVVVEVGNTEYLFSNGPLCWTELCGYGPSGLFMLSRDKISNKIENRTLFSDNGHRMPVEGWQAAVAKYPGHYWGPFKK